MGCLCAKAALPVPTNLVGTWISGERALDLRTGFGKYRYKRGRMMGVNPGSRPCTRLRVGEDGVIAYAKAGNGNHITLIDMPVTQWATDQMVLTCGAPPLQYTLEGQGEGASLVVNGERLQRHITARQLNSL